MPPTWGLWVLGASMPLVALFGLWLPEYAASYPKWPRWRDVLNFRQGFRDFGEIGTQEEVRLAAANAHAETIEDLYAPDEA